MKIAITGGTGFVGGHLARVLAAQGHHVVIVACGADCRDRAIRQLTNATFDAVAADDEDQLAAALTGCDAVAHCAGINREQGAQTYDRVHRRGTQSVANAARCAGVKENSARELPARTTRVRFGLSRIEVRGGGHRARVRS